VFDEFFGIWNGEIRVDILVEQEREGSETIVLNKEKYVLKWIGLEDKPVKGSEAKSEKMVEGNLISRKKNNKRKKRRRKKKNRI